MGEKSKSSIEGVVEDKCVLRGMSANAVTQVRDGSLDVVDRGHPSLYQNTSNYVGIQHLDGIEK